MKKTFFLILVLIFLKSSFAQTVGLNEATDFAEKFVKNKNNSKIENCIYTEKLLNGNNAFYVFNIKPSGFIIISADKKIKPVLAYSLNSNFSTNIPDFFQNILNSYKNGIEKIVNDNKSRTLINYWNGNYYSVEKSTHSVPELMETNWGQRPYYNQFCPENCPTGCVTTATSQIMKYYNHPAQGNGNNSYQTDHYGILSANFGATTYDWDNMPTELGSSSSAVERNAVAKLMYHVAIALEVDFTPDESNTYPNKVADILSEYFSYSSAAKFIKKSNFTSNTWINKLEQQLDSGRVILYTGFCSEENVGHAFVLDGYDFYDYFHVNWGWNGWYNGYFELNDLTPVEGYSFNETQGAVIDIIPVDSYSNIELFGDLQLSSQNLSFNDELMLGADIANYGNLQFYGDIKASVFDTNDVFVSDIEILENVSIAAQDYSSLTFYTDNTGLVDGIYKLGIYYRNNNEPNWQLVNQDVYSNPITINVNNNNTNGLITNSNILVNPDPIEESAPVQIEFDILNSDTITFNGNISLWLHELNGDSIETISDTNINLLPNENANIVVNTVLSDLMGTYKIVVWKKGINEDTWSPVGVTSFSNSKQVDIVLPDAFSLPPDAYENNNNIENAYEIPQNWENNLCTFQTSFANIHSATNDSADYYKFTLDPGYNYSIYAYINDSYTDTSYTNDVIFKVKLSSDTIWSVYYDDDDMGVIDFNNIANTTIFYVCVNPFFVGNLGSYNLNLMIERNVITNTKNFNNENNIVIYPNPAKQYIFIKNVNNIKNVELFDITGNLFIQNLKEDNNKIDLAGIKTGSYLLKIKTIDNKIFTKKIIILP